MTIQNDWSKSGVHCSGIGFVCEEKQAAFGRCNWRPKRQGRQTSIYVFSIAPPKPFLENCRLQPSTLSDIRVMCEKSEGYRFREFVSEGVKLIEGDPEAVSFCNGGQEWRRI